MTIQFKDGTIIRNINSYVVCEYDVDVAHAMTEDGAYIHIRREDVQEIRGDIVEKV